MNSSLTLPSAGSVTRRTEPLGTATADPPSVIAVATVPTLIAVIVSVSPSASVSLPRTSISTAVSSGVRALSAPAATGSLVGVTLNTTVLGATSASPPLSITVKVKFAYAAPDSSATGV